MSWAMATAHQQHSQAIAEATAAAELAQKTGQGPKPMMVTPYKHNWVIAAKVDKDESEEMYVLELLQANTLLGGLIGQVLRKTGAHYGESVS